MRGAARNGLRRDPTLPVGGAGEWQDGLLTGEHVVHFDHVADRPYVRVRGAHLRIDDDAAARTYL